MEGFSSLLITPRRHQLHLVRRSRAPSASSCSRNTWERAVMPPPPPPVVKTHGRGQSCPLHFLPVLPWPKREGGGFVAPSRSSPLRNAREGAVVPPPGPPMAKTQRRGLRCPIWVLPVEKREGGGSRTPFQSSLWPKREGGGNCVPSHSSPLPKREGGGSRAPSAVLSWSSTLPCRSGLMRAVVRWARGKVLVLRMLLQCHRRPVEYN
jgi:hypothetical protein